MRIDRIKIDGIEELDAQLVRLGSQVATEIAEEAVQASANALAEQWRLAAPYAPGYRIKSWATKAGVSRASYGHLRDNIRVFPLKSVKVTFVGYRVTTGDAFWGYFLEYGTIKMRARPWARPTLDRFKSRMRSIQIQIFNEGIAGALSGGRKAATKAGRQFGAMLPNGRNG